MQTFDFTAAGRQVNSLHNFIRYEREDTGAVLPGVRVRVDGNDLGVWLPGDWLELGERGSLVELSPVGTAAGVFRIGLGRFGSQRNVLVGSISAQVLNARNTQVTPAHVQRTVTSASAQMLAALATRQYLLIQNTDVTGSIWVTLTTGPATVANGLLIAPGAVWEWDSTIPVGAVFAIGDVASNVNILTIEG